MNLKPYLFLLSSAFTLHASAQFTEQFNSRQGIAGADIRNYLQASCWHFSSFTCSNKPGELIEGDGSLLSTPPANAAIPAGIYSPLLDMQSELSVMFKYRFLSRVKSKDPSIRIYLANAGNEPEILLDTIAVDAQNNSVFAYNRLFNHIPPGPHKFVMLSA